MIVLFDGLLPVKSNFESEANATGLHAIPSAKVLGTYIVYVACLSVCLSVCLSDCLFMHVLVRIRMYI